MMDEHQRPLIGTHLMLIKDGKLLLQKRNSGALKGIYTPVSGHVDGHETVIEALVREAMEEAGIVINPSNLAVKVVAHLPNAPYKGGYQDIINFFCFTDKFAGTIENREPDKCESLEFYDLENLPIDMMSHVFDVIKAYKSGQTYVVWHGKDAKHT